VFFLPNKFQKTLAELREDAKKEIMNSGYSEQEAEKILKFLDEIAEKTVDEEIKIRKERKERN
jgi:hypothetical protein